MKNFIQLRSLFLITLLFIQMIPTAQAKDESDSSAIQSCLAYWGKHPFHSKEPAYRVVSSKVKVLGIGKSMSDDQPTDQPDLVLIKPSVTVLSKAEFNLLNPNGWYCLKGQVSVLGKSEVKLHCKAHLASSRDGATVLGSNADDHGVAVLGSIQITKVD